MGAGDLCDAEVEGVVPALRRHLRRQQPVRLWQRSRVRERAARERAARERAAKERAVGERERLSGWRESGWRDSGRYACPPRERRPCNSRRNACVREGAGGHAWTMTRGLEAFMEKRKLW